MSVKGASPRMRGWQDAAAGRLAEQLTGPYADGYQAWLKQHVGEVPLSRAYDPIPDLAALVDGVRLLAVKGGDLRELRRLLAGPYARLRGGLLLDEPGRGDMSTEAGIRDALAAYITPKGRLLADADIEALAAEAEAGYDTAPPPHPELGPGSGHQLDGPADCARCQLLRDNPDFGTYVAQVERDRREGGK